MTHPSNLITDYLLGAVCLALALPLGRAALQQRSAAMTLWTIAYVTAATAALAGGTYHGFYNELDAKVAAVIWEVSMFAMGLTSAALLSASATFAAPERHRTTWYIAIIVKFCIFAWWMSGHDEFRYVVADMAVSILAIIGLHSWRGYQSGDRSQLWVVAAMLIAVAGAVLQQWKISLHAHFDHNDLYHIVQIVALVVMARALLAMRA
ncbi:MAG: hypothetical protein L0Y45_03750 [Woeseiaceae bacterium]|nr:hypothetical protein [Woeseiaceae bacterium]